VVARRPRDPRRAEEWEDSPERRCRSINEERMQQPLQTLIAGVLNSLFILPFFCLLALLFFRLVDWPPFHCVFF
jgi:hypothetical protein